ncbi:putative phosphatidylinositol N-acetylglucosaminyltransferase subunit Y [Heracleum sosnowskyi]|uniref:Phosphatidylinositol N-acetylglucosaminyltransferase subunit Y n=1 Tax=Heracleum sosnowskyi TaxID=360622 RepID=A0AAD8N664_9APIA|nr:putative phosphatidylinositol N-acetylglucosaminyltransferase subunit Y [Heracleum sosnowskyi]
MCEISIFSRIRHQQLMSLMEIGNSHIIYPPSSDHLYCQQAPEFESYIWLACSVQGLIMVFVGSFTFLGFLYAAIISKLLPPSENSIVAAIQNDRYYCFLVPLTLPIIIVAVYFHWLSMKLFKHA